MYIIRVAYSCQTVSSTDSRYEIHGGGGGMCPYNNKSRCYGNRPDNNVIMIIKHDDNLWRILDAYGTPLVPVVAAPAPAICVPARIMCVHRGTRGDEAKVTTIRARARVLRPRSLLHVVISRAEPASRDFYEAVNTLAHAGGPTTAVSVLPSDSIARPLRPFVLFNFFAVRLVSKTSTTDILISSLKTSIQKLFIFFFC